MISDHLDMESEFGPVLENLNAQLSQRETQVDELTQMLLDERRAHNACHEAHDGALHQMRVIGFAQAEAIRRGKIWGKLDYLTQAEYLENAERVIAVIDDYSL